MPAITLKILHAIDPACRERGIEIHAGAIGGAQIFTLAESIVVAGGVGFGIGVPSRAAGEVDRVGGGVHAYQNELWLTVSGCSGTAS